MSHTAELAERRGPADGHRAGSCTDSLDQHQRDFSDTCAGTCQCARYVTGASPPATGRRPFAVRFAGRRRSVAARRRCSLPLLVAAARLRGFSLPLLVGAAAQGVKDERRSGSRTARPQ